MTQKHAAFRRVRSLEPRLWKSYLQGLGSSVSDPANMIIYHWRDTPEKTGQSIKDFKAFAIFRKSKSNIGLYLLIILFLGAIGSTLQSLLSALVSLDGHTFCVQLIVLAILIVAAWAVYMCSGFSRKRKR
jgi:hypothetical protein